MTKPRKIPAKTWDATEFFAMTRIVTARSPKEIDRAKHRASIPKTAVQQERDAKAAKKKS